ncbi:hypothetical protein BJY59DRAFT_701516 [Rhodotorula toruloides]
MLPLRATPLIGSAFPHSLFPTSTHASAQKIASWQSRPAHIHLPTYMRTANVAAHLPDACSPSPSSSLHLEAPHLRRLGGSRKTSSPSKT